MKICIVILLIFIYFVDSFGFLKLKPIRQHISQNYQKSSTTTVIKMSVFPDPAILVNFQQGLLVNLGVGTLLSVSNQKSLTKEGLIHSGTLGVGLWTFLGFEGWLLCVSYLILGSLVTKIKMKEKESLGLVVLC